MCICTIIGVHKKVWGYPEPNPEAGIEAWNNSLIYEGQLLEAFQFIQILALGFIKLGALFFYRRIFSTGSPNATFNTILYLYIVITILWIIAMLIMNGAQCGSHISTLWTTSVSDYIEYCIYTFPWLMGFAISNFLLDLMILALPLPKIWSLHANTARKFALTMVFGLAAIGLAASAVRMSQYIRLTEYGPDPNADGHLEDTGTVFWSNLECGLCLLAVNLPSLSAIFGNTSFHISQLVASLRSAISLRSTGSDSHHSSRSRTRGAVGGEGTILSVDSHAVNSQVRLHGPTKGQGGDWYRLGELESRDSGADVPRAGDSMDYHRKSDDKCGNMV